MIKLNLSLAVSCLSTLRQYFSIDAACHSNRSNVTAADAADADGVSAETEAAC